MKRMDKYREQNFITTFKLYDIIKKDWDPAIDLADPQTQTLIYLELIYECMVMQ